MTDEEALLAAILAEPKDDTPRLVYADWLEENDQPERAEFIRVQVESAGLEPCNTLAKATGWRSPAMVDRTCDCRWHVLRCRERELWNPVVRPMLETEPWKGWLINFHQMNLHEGEKLAVISRGFVSSLTCTWDAWLTHADAILKQQPIERVRLTTRPEVESQLVPPVRGRVRFSGEEWWLSATPGNTEEENIRLLLKYFWPTIEFELPPTDEITFRGHSLITDATIG